MSEYEDVVTDIIRQNNSARQQAIVGLEDSPDNAVRALQLARGTGANPNVIMGDLDNFDQSHKRTLASELIRSNAHLADYINSNPIHGKLSSDDYGQLDTISTSLGKFRQLNHDQGILGLPTRVAGGAVDAGLKGFKEGFGDTGLGNWVLTVPQLEGDRLAQAIAGVGGMPIELPFRILAGGIHATTEAVKAGTKEAYKTFTGDEQGAERFSRDIAGMVEQQVTGQGVHGAFGDAATFMRYSTALRTSKLWIDAGTEPPPRLNPEIDKIKLDQNNADVKALDGMLSKAQKSVTRERDPDTFANFVRMKDEGSISIDAEAISKLYGDKLPDLEDGLLGWAPKLAEQLEAARASGADVEIPLADWLARVDPEVAKALRDDIRVRPGGITKNEAKLASEQKAELEIKDAEIIPDDLPTLRHATSLEPLFSIGDRKLKLEKRPPRKANAPPGKYPDDAIRSDEFKLVDENGQNVGWLEVVPYDGGTKLYIDNVGGMESKGYGPQSFGPALMRDLMRQLKEAYPEATQLGGFRISGAREKAGSEKEAWIKFDAGDAAVAAHFRDVLAATWTREGMGVEALYKKTELLTSKEREVIQAVREELARIAPGVDVKVPSSIYHPEAQSVKGVYIQYADDFLPKILVSLEAGDKVGVARHEAIHHLKRMGMFTEGEWAKLTRAARDEDWVTRYDIQKRYPNLDTAGKLEEAIAEGYKYWKSGELILKDATIFQKLKDLFEAIKTRMKEIFGREISWEELFQKVDKGEVGARDPTSKVGEEPAFSANEPELPGLTRMEDRPLFRTPATIGMNAQQMKLYERRLADMHEADVKWSEEKAQKEQRKRLTAEWKLDYKNTRAEVESDMLARPDVAADMLFARGELFGEKLPEKVRIDPIDLTAQERAAIPKDYLAKEGQTAIDLDDVAGLLGYTSTKELIENLVSYNLRKTQAGMSAKAFVQRVVDIETEARMKTKHGDLEQTILEEAKDQVTSETQLDLIAEEVLALGIRNNAEATINKAELKEWVQDKFTDTPMKGITSDKYLNAAGKTGRAAEIGLLKGEIDTAFRAKQQQYMAMLLAKEARTLEKEQKQFGKTVQKLSKRDVKGLDNQYQDAIQMLLWQIGATPRRSMPEIQASLAKQPYATLPDLVAGTAGDGWQPMVSGDIIAGNIKPLDQMTVGEFREFKLAIDSLNYIGRQTEKINVAGMKEDWAVYKAEVLANITSLPRRAREGQGNIFYQMDASLTRMENIMKDLDVGQELGPLFNSTIRLISQAKDKEYSMQEKLSTDIKTIEAPKEWKKSLKETLPNEWFENPAEGNLFKMTRADLINIMLNWGNRQNIKKFSMGWGSKDPGKGATKAEAAEFETQMKAYIDQHARPEDWKFVQSVWDIYEGYRDQIDTVGRNTTGTNTKFVEANPVDTPFGQMKGGYYPLIQDRYMSNPGVKEISADSLFGPDYFNAATPQSHLKERTGASYYVDFRAPISAIPNRMQQVIHDIAYREAVMSTKKIIGDRDIRNAIRNHYGAEYEAQLEPWLKKTARGSSVDEAGQEGIDRILRKTRLGLVAHALPFNYRVLLTPDVGAPTPTTMMGYFNGDWSANRALAMEKSKEIPHAIYNMDRDFREAMQKAVGEGRLDAARADATRWGYSIVTYVSREFRAATFIGHYKRALAEGRSDAEAAVIADSYVREQHSTASIADLPSVMTGGEKSRLLTMFYGYFNTQYNWARTIPGHARRGDYWKALEAAYGSVIIGSVFGAVVTNNMRQDDTWAKQFAKAIPLQLLGMVPFAREAATMAIEGIPPRSAYGTAIQAGLALSNDVKKWVQGKPVDAPIKHTAAVVGIYARVPGTLQMGRTGQGLYDVAKGKQHPRDFMEWARLLATGEAKLKRQGER